MSAPPAPALPDYGNCVLPSQPFTLADVANHLDFQEEGLAAGVAAIMHKATEDGPAAAAAALRVLERPRSPTQLHSTPSLPMPPPPPGP